LGRGRLGRGPLVAWLIYTGPLLPALGFIDVYPMRFSYVADHFQYLAVPALFALVAAAGHWAVRHAALRPGLLPLVGAALLLGLGIACFGQAHMYHDARALWEDTLKKNPDAWIAHNNLGNLLWLEGRDDEAIEHYQEAIRLNPRDAAFHNNLGEAHLHQGKNAEAVVSFAEAVRLDPRFHEAHFNLGRALRRQGKTEAALGHFQEAIRWQPGMVEAHNNLGVALMDLKKVDEALVHFREAARAAPDDPTAYYNLALAHAQLGKYADALGHVREALRLRPRDARFQELLHSLEQEKR
jgi:tetratricopeptide (TPR) repeat protein